MCLIRSFRKKHLCCFLVVFIENIIFFSSQRLLLLNIWFSYNFVFKILFLSSYLLKVTDLNFKTLSNMFSIFLILEIKNKRFLIT